MFSNIDDAIKKLLNQNYNIMKDSYDVYLLVIKKNGVIVGKIENLIYGRASISIQNDIIVKVYYVE